MDVNHRKSGLPHLPHTESLQYTCSTDAFSWGGLATGRCGRHAQASRQAKHCAHRGILMLMS